MIMSIHAKKKAFDNIKHSFMIKSFKNQRWKEFPQLNKGIL